MTDEPTPGQAALIEAMRIEQAKIYGRLCREQPREPAPVVKPRLRVIRGAA